MRARPESSTEVIAAWLAQADGEVQAKFLNQFADEMRHVCGNHYRFETQGHYMRDHLTENAKDLISTLAYESEAKK